MAQKFFKINVQSSNIPVYIEETQNSIESLIQSDFIIDNYTDQVTKDSIQEISKNEFDESYKNIISLDKNKTYRIFVNDYSNEIEKTYKAKSYEALLELIEKLWRETIIENEWRENTQYYATQIMHENQMLLYNEEKDGIIFSMDITVCE